MTGLAPKFHLPEGVASPDEAIASVEQFPAYFQAGVKPASTQLLGVEYERISAFIDANRTGLVDRYRNAVDRPSSLLIEVRKDLVWDFAMIAGMSLALVSVRSASTAPAWRRVSVIDPAGQAGAPGPVPVRHAGAWPHTPGRC